MTTNDTRSRGVYQRLTDPEGTRYLLHAVPSGYLGFSVSIPQGGIEALIQTFGVTVERFASRAEAEAAFDRMADTIRRTGLR
jgi:hypothetical protein